MRYIKSIIIFLVLINASANAMIEDNIGKEYYEEDCASSCHQADPRIGHTGLVILNRFDLRSQILTCSSNYAPFWDKEERSAVVDYLYSTFYKKQYAQEEIEKEESIMFNCEKKVKSPFTHDF